MAIPLRKIFLTNFSTSFASTSTYLRVICSRGLHLAGNTTGARKLNIFFTNLRGDLPQKTLDYTPIRYLAYGKSKKGKGNTKNVAEESDSESEADELQDNEPGIGIKDKTAKLLNLRVDTVLKAGLGLSKAKVESAMYDSRLRVNGDKVLKKSRFTGEGDEIDLVKGPNQDDPNKLDISRVILLSASVPTGSDRIAVKLRAFKHLTIDNYKEAWQN